MTKTVTVNVQFTSEEHNTLSEAMAILYEISEFYGSTAGDTLERQEIKSAADAINKLLRQENKPLDKPLLI